MQQGQLNERTAQFYKDSYNDLKLMYYSELSLQTTFKNSKSLFNIKDDRLINISSLNNYTMLRMLRDPKNSEDILKETSRILMYLNAMGVKGFRSFKEFFAYLSPKYLETIAESNTKIYTFTDKSETHYLYTNNSTIFAREGNDNIIGTFNGHSGNDYFFGGKGNDQISGGVGDDIYFFNLGDGQDTIYESNNKEDVNFLVFGEGILKENIEIYRLNQSDIQISIKDTEDKIKATV